MNAALGFSVFRGGMAGLLVPCLALAVNTLPGQQKVGAISSSAINHEPSTIPPPPSTLHPASFSRYQIILDRMPFGIEPAPLPLPTTNKPVQSDVATRALKMCAVTRNQMTGKLQVGLVDVATKKNYFLNVGETEDGITVLDADYEGEKAKLSKDGAESWITMTDAQSMASVTAAPSADARRTMMPGAPPGIRTRGMRSPPAPSAPAPAAPQEVATTPKLTGEALKKHLEQYQMDLIRSRGEKGPPLPMELTPEMDAQLVKEGVLPPQQ